MNKKVKDKMIGVRVDPDTHKAALELAKADGGISKVLQRYLAKYVARKQRHAAQ